MLNHFMSIDHTWIPFAFCNKLKTDKTELELLQQQNSITPIMEATEWYAPIVVIPKKNTENICMCVHLSHLNRYVQQEQYMSPTPAEAIADIAADASQYLMLWRATTSALLTKTANF